MNKLCLLILVIAFISSCRKDEVRVPNNVPPPDHTVDSSTIQIYINKAYIDIIGREPIGNEKQDAMTILRQNNFSVDNRKQFLDGLFTKDGYNLNLYNVARNEYLRNTDSADIEGEIQLFAYLLTQTQYASYYATIQYELLRLDTLQTIVQDMNNGTLDYRGMLRRCVNNYFYDQINMGTENFVVSVFQNFLFRYPTDAELTASETMVNGFASAVFFQTGQTKNDYISIFFSSNDYFEGQVRFIFKKYLFREPTSAEIPYYANIYKSSNNYKSMAREIFSLNEFAGVH